MEESNSFAVATHGFASLSAIIEAMAAATAFASALLPTSIGKIDWLRRFEVDMFGFIINVRSGCKT